MSYPRFLVLIGFLLQMQSAVPFRSVGRAPGNSIGVDPLLQGVVCDGAVDDTFALNRMFARVADWSTIIWPADCQMKITRTVDIHGKQGLRLVGLGSPGSSGGAPKQGHPTFLWYGEEGGTMISINRSRGLYIEGLTVLAKRGSNSNPDPIAYVGIDVDQSDPNVQGITSDIVFERMNVSLPGSDPHQQFFRAFQFSKTSNQNVEDMVIRDSYIQGGPLSRQSTGVGIYIGNSPNAKGYQLENDQLVYCARGVEAHNGSFQALNSFTEGNMIDFFLHTWTEPITIQGIVAEGDHQFVVVDSTGAASAAPLRIVGNKIATSGAPPGAAVFSTAQANLVYLESNKTEGDADRIFSGSTNANLISKNNLFHTASMQTSGIDTFEQGYTVEGDIYWKDHTGYQVGTGRNKLHPVDFSKASSTAPIKAGTPLNSSGPCTANNMLVDANYFYVCTGPNRWKRVPLASF